MLLLAFSFNLAGCTPKSSSSAAGSDSPAGPAVHTTSGSPEPTLDYEVLWPGKKKLVWVCYMFSAIPNNVVKAFNDELVKQGCGSVVEFLCPEWKQGKYCQTIRDYKKQGKQVDLLTSGLSQDEKNTNAGAVKDGLFYDMTDMLLNQPGKTLYHEFAPVYWQTSAINGRVYGLNMTSVVSSKPSLVFSKKYLKQYNLKAEDFTDWTQLYQKLSKIDFSKQAKGFCPVILGDLDPFAYYFADLDVLEDTVAVQDQNGKPVAVNQYKNEKYVTFLKMLNSMVKSGLLSSKGYSNDAGELLESGEYFVQITTGSGQLKDDSLNPYHGEIQTIEAGPGFFNPLANNFAGIASWSKQKDAAFDVLSRVYTSPVLSNLLEYGVEGKQYKMVNGRAAQTGNSYVGVVAPANMFITLPGVMLKETQNKAEAVKKEMESARRAPGAGFVPDTAAIAEQMKALRPIVKEADQCWQDKNTDMDAKIAEINKKLENAGLGRVLEEMNRQLTAWCNGRGNF